MTIYGEYLFLENFLIGYLILKLTGRLCGRKTVIKRQLAGGIMAGLFSFTIFVSLPGPLQWLFQGFFAFFLIFMVFRPKSFFTTMRITAVFYGVTLLLGGAAVALICTAGVRAVRGSFIFYLGNFKYFHVILGAGIGYILVSSSIEYMQSRTGKERELIDIIVEMNGNVLGTKGIIDTGNSLVEPLSKWPAALIQKKVFEQTFGKADEDTFGSRMRMIPFQAVGCSGGMLTGIRCDRIILKGLPGEKTLSKENSQENQEGTFVEKAYLALYDGDFQISEYEGACEVLLHKDMIKRGVT